MIISKNHHDNTCDRCNKKGKFTAYMDDLDPNYFVKICIDCYNKEKKK